MFDVSEYGTVRLESWDDDWWGKAKAKEVEVGHPVCGVRDCGVMCEEMPETRVGRCRKHWKVIERTTDIFRDPVYSGGVRGIRVCSKDCPRVDECEYYFEGFDRREWGARPYCFVEIGLYQNHIAELIGEVERNEVAVTQVVKMMIQAAAMCVVQIGRCDEEMAGGKVVLDEVSVWKVKDSERTTTKPVENPAVAARAKLLKTLMDLTSKLLLSPKDKDEKKQLKKGKEDESPSEVMGRLLKGVNLPALKEPEVGP